jgi:hypothetical protein
MLGTGLKNIILLLVLCAVGSQTTGPNRKSDREHDGFVGPVKKVFMFWTPISGSNYPDGSKCRELTNEYDQTGRITRHSVYPGSCGSDEIRDDYTYSQDGNKTTKRQDIPGENSPPGPPPPVAPPNAKPNAKRENGPAKEARKYDDSGRLIESGIVMPSGKYIYKNAHTYDAKGRLIESTGFDGENQVTDRRVYTYSGDERVSLEFTYYGRDGKISGRTMYTDYEFNSKGDWIKRKETKESFNRRSISMTYREIEYYPDTK